MYARYLFLALFLGSLAPLAWAAEPLPSDAAIRDEQGRLRSRTEKDRIHDKNGYLRGRIGPTGQITDERGYVKGRIDASGRVTDERGRFRGRVQGGTIYDEKGFFKGRVEKR